MNSLLFYVTLVISSVSVLLAAPADVSTHIGIPNTSTLPTDINPQYICPEVRALPFQGVRSSKPVSFSLYVGRIKASIFDDPASPTDLNTCSPLTYSTVCQGTHVSVNIEPDGTKIVRSAAYNDRTKNVVCYEQSLSQEDPKYHIFKGALNRMTVIGQDGVVTEIPKETIPQSIVDLQNKQIITLWYGDKFSYGIYATCDSSSVWVSYAERIINENLVDSLKAEIDQKLIELGFALTDFIDLPIEIPFGVDQCLNPSILSSSEESDESDASV